MSDRLADEERAEVFAREEHGDPTLDPVAYARQTRRSLLAGGVAALAGFGGWRWLQGRPSDDRIPDVLRRGHEINEALWRRLTREQTMAPTFDRSESSMMRVNGRHGLEDELDVDSYQISVQSPDGSVIGTHTMSDVRAFTKVEMTVEHKCVEGWSHVVTWGGTRFSEFASSYADQLGGLPRYVSLETPDGDYYVGMDMESMLHPQTLLAYELQGEPLAADHGAPVRLATPNKYGTKQLKRVGTITFTDEQPADYWGERGYDWYAQL